MSREKKRWTRKALILMRTRRNVKDRYAQIVRAERKG